MFLMLIVGILSGIAVEGYDMPTGAMFLFLFVATLGAYSMIAEEQ